MRSIGSNSDLIVGVLTLLLASGFLVWLTYRVTRRCPPWVSRSVAVAFFGLTLLFAARFLGQLQLARIIPFSNVIVLGNWLPLGAAILSGIVVGESETPFWRRMVVVVMLSGLAWYTVGFDLLAKMPTPEIPQYRDGFCMQTTPDSCSACCAASLLIEHGIPATESEMMQLCFTRRGGTPELGLYRGLKLKTQGTAWDVEVLSCDADTFLEEEAYPALLLVDTTGSDGTASHFWSPRKANHAIVAFGMSEYNTILIADPSAGLRTWSIDRFRTNWLGGGLRLVEREQPR